jgi:hypothetical protein
LGRRLNSSGEQTAEEMGGEQDRLAGTREFLEGASPFSLTRGIGEACDLKPSRRCELSGGALEAERQGADRGGDVGVRGEVD